MRRTTQWAVFTSMNQRQPVWRSMYEPAETADDAAATEAETTSPAREPEPEPASARDARRDRVDFM